MPQIFHPLLALIASATNNELAKYVEYLKQENKILRARILGQIHTRRDEREPLWDVDFFSIRTVTVVQSNTVQHIR